MQIGNFYLIEHEFSKLSHVHLGNILRVKYVQFKQK